MENALLALSLLSCIALIVSVLLQRSEGGALGMGGGGSGGGLVSGRGAADTLVRVTMVLAAIFFVTSLALTRINYEHSKSDSEVSRTLKEEGGSLLSDELGLSDNVLGVEEEPADLISEELAAESVATSENAESPVSDGTETDENSAPKSENQ
ncbi:preprotein translocase subunit SecG [Hirschia litorea]|uniref:Protein-export membrane protein SecG n=1 Tax=Hirschia litorea TaxID=1199156 RepID=A0ABW2IHH7_9PROT